jgi:RNA polymerase sigma-70 factor (ECF subfamily)
MFGRLSKKERQKKAAFDAEAIVHMDAIYNSALYMTRNAAEAEDLVQETFLKAYRYFDKYQLGTNCKAWLYRIMTNTFLNTKRKSVRQVTFLDEVDTGMGEGIAPREKTLHLMDPEAAFVHGTVSETVQDAIASLPKDFRVAVVLCDLQDFSYKEIADMMDCPVGTVMSRIYRGRKLLQKRLTQYAVEQGVIPRMESKENSEPTSLSDFRQRREQQTGGQSS